jgi:hypothetical protein
MTTLEVARMEKAKRYLRLFLRDTPELNRLLRKKETPDDLLEFSIEMTISDWNSTPPLIGGVSIMTFPGLYMLMLGSAINVLISQGIYQARNELTYQAGNSSFQRFNKSNYYMQWMINLDNKYQQNKRNMKIHQNVSRGWGGANSEYDRLGFMW